ncbi:MAG: hypothetical protein JWQ89_451 [Devosia sp.]|uniref:hypothetical protein n=1 Tax=Devosia sp. TaxID=1871048 RepID=UPI002612362F|nr:hypothetical protein [Devosia sp.]MDB5538724.1 hypothetical protein [Devosia sp.]
MTTITDDYMKEILSKSRPYTVIILRKGPNYVAEGARQVVWEHGRRNFELRASGKLAIVAPVTDDSDIAGIGFFTGSIDETRQLMEDDPGVKAGWFTFEVHPVRSFPGDSLPG